MSVATALPDPATQDARDWAYYLNPDERLLRTWRPDATFRLYGSGKAILSGSAVFVFIMLLTNLILGDGRGQAGLLILAIGMMGIAAILGYGPAKLDQRNRRYRRYAVTNQRALEFQDIRHGRLKSVAFGPLTRVLKLFNGNMESHEVSFVTVDDQGHAVNSVLFERLTEPQADAVFHLIRSEKLPAVLDQDTRIVTALARRRNLAMGQRRQ